MTLRGVVFEALRIRRARTTTLAGCNSSARPGDACRFRLLPSPAYDGGLDAPLGNGKSGGHVDANFKWAVLAGAIAVFGGWACGSGGGGGSSTNVCDEKASSFDEDACSECLDEAFECRQRGICGREFQAANACAYAQCGAEIFESYDCRDEAYDSCDDPDEFDWEAVEACVDAKCGPKEAAANSCVRSKCRSEANAVSACWSGGCPGAAACTSY